MANHLLSAFGSLGAISAAPDRLLARELRGQPQLLAYLKLLRRAHLYALRRTVAQAPILSTSKVVLDYLHAELAHEPLEQFRILYLDARNGLLRAETVARGSVDECHVPLRDIMHRALDLSATAMILVHNHPSGSLVASTSDCNATRRIVSAANLLNIAVHDHLIISREGHFSFRSAGLL